MTEYILPHNILIVKSIIEFNFDLLQINTDASSTRPKSLYQSGLVVEDIQYYTTYIPKLIIMFLTCFTLMQLFHLVQHRSKI